MKETVYRISNKKKMKIALVADLHNVSGRSALLSMEKNRPDLIAVSGDLIAGHNPKEAGHKVESQKNVLPFVRGCAEIAPTFVSVGNHEWMLTDDELGLFASAGAAVLDNTWTEREGVVIGGLSSALRNICSFERDRSGVLYPKLSDLRNHDKIMTSSEWLSEFERQKGYKILLCHHPEYWCLRDPFLISRRIDLVLSGHTHGGQFRFLGQGAYAPGQGWFPKFTSGVHGGPNGKLIISRGLSNPARPIPRIFNRTEVVYIIV